VTVAQLPTCGALARERSEAGVYSVTITDLQQHHENDAAFRSANSGASTELCAVAAAPRCWRSLHDTCGALRSDHGTACITVSEAGVYSVTITDANGCSSTCEVTVVENDSPICSITGGLTICEGASTELCAPAGAASYLWSTGATTACITVSEAGVYSVTITDANGCSSTCEVTVVENDAPICTITGGLSICEGASTELCATGTGTYLWSTGATTSCITVSESGIYSVTITSPDGCESTCQVEVIVNPEPVCTITGGLILCEGESTELCATGTGTYLWSTGATTSCITVSEAGIYSVTITSPDGCESTCQVEVEVTDAPVCVITGDNILCEGGSVELCVPAGAMSYLWSNGETTNCITVSEAGIYSVTVTYALGCESICEIEVIVNPLPICEIIGDLILCEGESTELCATGMGTFLWSTGETTSCITVSEAGIYSVTITSPDGCESTCQVVVEVNPLPICSITGGLILCEGESTELCATGTGTYLWSTGETTSCITVSEAGIYSVTITSPDGCESTCQVEVEVTDAPVCVITGDNILCEGGSVELCVPAGAMSYLWSTGATTNCITVSEAGIYSVTVTYALGCESICQTEVSVNPEPICSIIGDLILCEGESTQLCASGDGTFLWSTGETTACISVDVAGIYSVTITSPDGCESTCDVEVEVNPLPICEITGGLILCEGESTELCATGEGTYLWSTGATTSCITVSEAGIYSVTITSPDGCESTCQVEVEVTEAPVCVITGDNILCEGGSVELCVPAGAMSYLWSTGETTNCITVSEAGIYSVTVTYALGCESICQTEVSVNPEPICSIIGDLILCEGESTQLCASGDGTFLWSTGETTACISVDVAGIYSVTITSPDGCESTCDVEVEVNPLPICEITGGLILCEGESTELCATGEGTYLWSTGATTSCITVSEAGIYSVTITSPDGCESTCQVEVEVTEAPVCVITGDNILCEGGSVELCVPAGAMSYLWSNGETTNCITVSEAGIYSVTVTYALGCESICQIEVIVNPEPICSIIGDLILCEGESTQLCASGDGTYLWSTGETTNCITVSEAGIYSVTITSPDGCESTCQVEVEVNPLPICSITGGLILCEGESTELCATGTGTYLWSTGATTSCITVSEAGIYSVTITSPDGCESTCQVEVEVTDAPVCVITGDNILCEGGSVELCVPAGAMSYLWSNGETTNCITVSEAGIYSVTVTYALGCESICQIEVIVNPEPICSIIGDLILCEGESTQLCASGDGTYLWSTGETTNCITVSEAGIYSVTITSPDGCESTCQVEVIVNPEPVCEITGGLILCEGESTELCATGTGTFLWSTGATTSCITVSEAGIYSVTITSPDGCESTCQVEVEVTDAPVCVITGDNILCEGGSVELCVPAGAMSYLWSTGETTNCITVSEAGIYSVTVTYALGCESICQTEVSVNPEPICSIIGDLILCEGESTQLCASGDGTFLWSTGETTSCITVSESGIYSVMITSEDGCDSFCEVEVIVTPEPVCTITGGLILCEGESTELCATGTGTFLWSTGETTSCITVSESGIYSVTITSPDGCDSFCEVEVIVTPEPVCTITGGLILCEGKSTELCATGQGTYLWSTGETTSCITVSEPGIYSVTITSEEGCDSFCQVEVEVLDEPVCKIIGNDTFCEGTLNKLCGTPGASSYLWSTGETTECIDVSVGGTYTLTVSNGPGCESTCSYTVTTTPPPVCKILGNDTFCEGTLNKLCGTPGASSYLWSTGETTECIDVSVGGTYTLTVSNGPGCESTCSYTVTTTPPPVCKIIGNDTFCEGTLNKLCGTPGASSYLWSTGETTECIDVSVGGTYTLTVSNGPGCESTCSYTVTTTPPPVCKILGNDTFCEGTLNKLCGTPGASSYLWSTGETTECIDVSVGGTYTLTVSNGPGCESTCSYTVTTTPAPVCKIFGNDSFCEGTLNKLCGTPGASSYLWSTGETTECIDVSVGGTYTLTVSNGPGCESTCSYTVTTTPPPVCKILGNDTFCEGTLNKLCGTPGASSYLWSTGETTECIDVSVGGTYTLTVSNGPGCESTCSYTVTTTPAPVCKIFGNDGFCEGTLNKLCGTPGASSYLWSTGETTECIDVSVGGTYTLTVSNGPGCESTCSYTVTTTPPPVCKILGNDTFCEGTLNKLCGTPGASSYLWSTGETTECIDVTVGGTYTLTVSSGPGCESTCSYTVTTTPPAVCKILGNDTFCEGTLNKLCGTPGASSYLWSTGETTECIDVSVGGTYNLTVSNGPGCESTCSITVGTTPKPVCEIIGSDTFCEGTLNKLCGTPGASSYLWSTGETTECIDVSVGGTYTLTVSNGPGCESTCSYTVTTTPAPVCKIFGNDGFCEGTLNKLCGTPGASSYLWSTGETTECIDVTVGGTYTLTVSNGPGCESTCSYTVTTTPAPVCKIFGNDTFCEGTLNKLCGTPGASSYLWSTGETTECIDVSVGGTYTLTVSNGPGCESTCSYTVSTTPAPVCKIFGNDSFCEGTLNKLCGTPGASSYLWSTGETTECIDVSVGGTYTLTVSNGPGCESTCSYTVTTTPPPVCKILGNDTFCEGTLNKLCGTPGASSYLWSTGETTECIDVSEEGIYSLTVTDATGFASGCVLSVVQQSIGTPGPIDGPTSVQTDQSASYSIDAVLGAAGYVWTLPDGWVGESTGTEIEVITDGAISNDQICVYAVVNGCPGPEVCLDISFSTGLVSVASSDWFTVGPNPSTGVFQVFSSAQNNGPIRIIVHDLLGQIVVAPVILQSAGSIVINMEHEASGVYFMRAVYGTESRVFELLIQR
jgi:trimeric autotransporter adhesin